MRVVIGQTRYYRERGREWEGVLAKRKAAPDICLFLDGGRRQQQCIAGFPNNLLQSVPLPALSQRNGWAHNERASEIVREGERSGGSGWGAVFNKGRREEGLELGKGTEKKGKQARRKALGNSTRVLSEWGGGQKLCSSKTKEDYGLGRCQATPPFVYSLIKGQPLPQKLENFLKDLMRQTERKLTCGRRRRAKLKHIKVNHILCLQTTLSCFLTSKQSRKKPEKLKPHAFHTNKPIFNSLTFPFGPEFLTFMKIRHRCLFPCVK